MEQQSTPPVAAEAAAVPLVQPSHSWLYRRLSAYRAWKKSTSDHPVFGTALALVVLLLGVGASEAWDYGKRKIVGPDEFLVQIADSQKVEFEELKKNLSQIKSSLSGGDRESVSRAQGAVDSLEKSNDQLIQQLGVAKAENAKLSSLAEARTGITGGYDFILMEDTGVRLDATTFVGLEYVTGGRAEVNLTAADLSTPKNITLRSGQSVSYKNASGRDCKVAVLGARNNGDMDSATFAVSCV